MLPRGLDIPGLNDSKKLTEKKREELYGIICAGAVLWRRLCRRGGDRAAQYPQCDVSRHEPRHCAAFRAAAAALIDGNRDSGIEAPSRCIVKGDALCADIAAASVLAKVTRDRYMTALASEYPQYGFEKHKGLRHEAALRRHPRIRPLARAQDELPEDPALMQTRELGRFGEEQAAKYLRRKGAIP